MEPLLERASLYLAKAYAVYGMAVLLLPSFLFLNLLLFAALVWAASTHTRTPHPRHPASVLRRPWVRLALEATFGLLNPVIYLAILTPSLPELRSSSPGVLQAAAWLLLAAFWASRLLGASLPLRSRITRFGLRALLWTALACVLLHAVKDASVLVRFAGSPASPLTLALHALRLGPLYLIPAVLLWDHLRSIPASAEHASPDRSRFFLLTGPAARVAVAGVLAFALATLALATHRRSDATLRTLVSNHREAIRSAAARYDVDPRLIAAMVYVTHRDELSPFRGALEQLAVAVWAKNLRREFGIGSPDHLDRVGTDENPLLNRALDFSVGLAQIKPRTAQTASVLATGLTPDGLPKPAFYSYRDVEPISDRWRDSTPTGLLPAPHFPVPAERHEVATALLDAESNLAMCALILALYQRQWEQANPAWSLRQRPDLLATLYQLGFSRSKPHAEPRSSAFGTRVSAVYGQLWLRELFATSRPPA